MQKGEEQGKIKDNSQIGSFCKWITFDKEGKGKIEDLEAESAIKCIYKLSLDNLAEPIGW